MERLPLSKWQKKQLKKIAKGIYLELSLFHPQKWNEQAPHRAVWA